MGEFPPKDWKPADWFSIARVAKALDERQWYWATDNFGLKYINVRIDTRDNHCVVSFEDRDGKRFASNITEFEAEMAKMDAAKTSSATFKDFKPKGQ